MTLWRVRATIDDRPGFLSVLAASLALRKVNILSVEVHTTSAGAVDDFLVETPEGMTEADLVEAVVKGRGRDPWVAAADERVLLDEPTRVLALATTVVADPAALEEVLASLLGECAITWRPESGTAKDGYTSADMQLLDPAGGVILIHRVAPAFTPAEYARAQALVNLARLRSRTTS
jgi:hypothetical protein